MEETNVSAFETPEEGFWAGAFGDEYMARNQGNDAIATNVALFSNILRQCRAVDSILEFGANIGMNLQALRVLLPNAKLSAIEINEKAVQQLRALRDVEVFHQSILSFCPDHTWEVVLTKGVLIHINPDKLSHVYRLLYESSHRYICLAEYYNPSPVTVAYRGHEEKLFKRDFAGEMLDRYKDLSLVDYGFVYHRDRQFPQDDLTWFLLEK